MTERFFWKLGGDFKRDLFSGVEELWTGRAGVGYFWTDRTRQDLKLGLAATYNNQKEKVHDPATKDSFAGARFTADVRREVRHGEAEPFTSKLASTRTSR